MLDTPHLIAAPAVLRIPDFSAFPKIPRLLRNITVTEKIDGTNASVYIDTQLRLFLAGSRNRWITRGDDNQGFAAWAYDHQDELIAGLGDGHHFGEWYGQKIARTYGLKERRFALFNTSRWGNPETRPACCDVVPVLYRGGFSEGRIRAALLDLETNGSKAVPGFMRPEGVCIYHEAAGQLFKITLGDDGHKGATSHAPAID